LRTLTVEVKHMKHVCLLSQLIIVLIICVGHGSSQSRIKILYTGKLFGYYNQDLLDRQRSCFTAHYTGDMSECTSDSYRAEAAADANTLATQYVRDVFADSDIKEHVAHPDMSVLVGMGDNLSPEIESRLQRYQWSRDRNLFEESVSMSTRVGPECLYPLKRLVARPGHPWRKVDSLDQAMRPFIAQNPQENLVEAEFAAQDNVLNFMLLAGYTAIVPGREDMLYGSVRLAKLSAMLRDIGSRNSLRILAANLRYQIASTKTSNHAQAPVGSNPCPLLLAMKQGADGALMAEPAADHCNPKVAQGVEDGGYRLVSGPNGKDILVIGVVAPDFLSQVSALNMTFVERDLGNKAGAPSYKVIVTDPQSEIRAILKRFETNDNMAATILLAQMPRGDAETLASHFSRSSLCGSQSLMGNSAKSDCLRVPVDVVVSEADEDLATESVSVTMSSGPNQSAAHLAVVTPHRAYSNFVHTLVPSPLSIVTITPQQSYENESKWQELDIPRWKAAMKSATSPSTAGERFRNTPVISPNHYGIQDADLAGIQALSDREFAALVLRGLRLQTGADVVILQRRDWFFDPPVNEYDTDSNCQDIGGDVDKHDCYLRNKFNRILWKGDVLTTTNLTGQQIINVIAKSQQLSDSDSQVQVRDISKQWLVTFGIWKPRRGEGSSGTSDGCPVPDPDLSTYEALTAFDLPSSCHCHVSPSSTGSDNSGQYCIDGKEIDPGRVYSVATTDTLASGSDIYTDFKTPAVGSLEALLVGGRSGDRSIVENVLDCWHAVAAVNARQGAPRCAATWPVVGDSGWDIPGGELPDEQDFFGKNNQKQSEVNQKNDDIYEFQHQERGILHYQLQQLMLSYTGYSPTATDFNIGKTFGGVSDSRVLQPHSSTVDIQEGFRLLWEARHYDFGMTSLLAYTKNIKGSLTGGADNVSYSNNQFSVGPVLQLHLGSTAHWGRFMQPDWNSKTAPNYKLVLSLAQFTGQVQRSQFAFADDQSLNKKNPPLSLSLDRVFEPDLQWGVGPRVGFRHEFNGSSHWFIPDKNSYTEGGYQFSFVRNVLTGLQLINPQNSPGFQVVTCSLETGISLADCVKSAQSGDKTPTDVIVGPNTKLNGLYAPNTVFARGWYWLGSLNFPLVHRGQQNISALIQGNGDFFNDLGIHNQYATQTRFDVTNAFGLQLPIWGNLSFVPQYSLFLYENQNNRSWLAGRTVMGSLRWTFDRNSAIGVKTALGAKSPGNAPSSIAGSTGK
jgi:hypothetical protein